MTNSPIGVFFALASRQADIKRALALWASVQSPNTELIDLVRSILSDIGLLDKPTGGAAPPIAVPSSLQKYSTQWFQKALNVVDKAGLDVDGNLGRDDNGGARESKTRLAVRKFQARHNIKVDGSPGVQTAALLEQELGDREV
jgi:Putative peptidoglycan binding domain